MLAGLFALGVLAASPARSAPETPPKETAVPFGAGEQLDYRIGWEKFLTAATARMRVVERRPFYGRMAWHFQTRARTVEPVRFLYALDDQFDSYTDAATLAGLQYETYLREPGKKEDNIVRMSTKEQPAGDDGPTVRVPEGTRDPLGALYSLRAHDWSRAETLQMPVYDGKKLYELRARKARVGEAVTVPAGSYKTTLLELHVYERGRELRDTLFRIWLSDDAGRVPVRIEAGLPVGTFRVELERHTDGKRN